MLFFTVLEWRAIVENTTLILANVTGDPAYYHGDSPWILRYNESIRLADQKQYSEAKTKLTPLLNDISNPKKAEIAELYGDLLYTTSGSIDDAVRMYERSIETAPNPRVSMKINYLKSRKTEITSTGSQNTPSSTGATATGSDEVSQKKQELQKTSASRSEYLGNQSLSTEQTRSELLRLIESAKTTVSPSTQDW
jgi:tetratricopeptide (TPR) repeat protein